VTPRRVTPDEWRHVEEIFLAALEKDGDTRSQYLDEVCRGKADIRAQVESLLAHAGGGTGTLESLVNEAARKLPASRDKYIDSKIGQYRILHRLDEGGMGVVYLAERSDEHYHQTVAIKLVKSGMEVSRGAADPREPDSPQHRRDSRWRQHRRRPALHRDGVHRRPTHHGVRGRGPVIGAGAHSVVPAGLPGGSLRAPKTGDPS
jgi:hypothetical protein